MPGASGTRHESKTISGESAIWNDDWAAQTGLPAEGFGAGQEEAEAQQLCLTSMEAFAEYQEAVFAATEVYLNSASDDDLEREVPARQGTESVGQAISLHMLGHFNGHRGEINSLRGMQGMPTVMAAQGTH